jgi:parallel beta-helix repeat protein
VSYSDLDVTGVEEDSLRMRRYKNGVWTTVPPPNGVNTAQNYVFSNITAFSVFAPMAAFGEAPDITIQSPQNITYLFSNVSLRFTANDTNGIDWTGYSLDGTTAIQSGNTTLTGLVEGAHNVTSMANNTLSNMATETEWFNVDKCIEDAAPNDICTFQPGNYSNFTLTTDNVTIACAVKGGCTIAGAGRGIGARIFADNATLTNFTLRDWTKGIQFCGEGITITNNTLIDNHVGIEACGSSEAAIEDNTITSTHSIGISLLTTHSSLVAGNEVSLNGTGILLKNSDSNLLESNKANQCEYGFKLAGKAGSDLNTLAGNEALFGSIWDYHLNRYSTGNTFTLNTYCKLRTTSGNSYSQNTKGGTCP